MKFERLAYLLVIGFLAGGICWLVIRQSASETGWVALADMGGMAGQDDPRQSRNAHDEFQGFASPELSPREVVTLQVNSLRDAVSQPERIRECFALAAPSNRVNTGPIDRFAVMVTEEPYRTLATAPRFTIGDPVVEEGFAAVLVTAAEEEMEPRVFRFVLQKQSESPYQQCWMTIGVQPVQLVMMD